MQKQHTYKSFFFIQMLIFCVTCVCACFAVAKYKTSAHPSEIMKVSHLAELSSSGRNPDRLFVCTVSQRPPGQTWWRVMSTADKGEKTIRAKTSAFCKRVEFVLSF